MAKYHDDRHTEGYDRSEEKSLWEGIWAESWMTESGQPMENLEEFIPDKGKGQARLKHSFFFFFFFLRQEKKTSMAIRRRKKGNWQVREVLWSHDYETSRPVMSVDFLVWVMGNPHSFQAIQSWIASHFENISWAQRRKTNYKGARMSTGSPVRRLPE